MSTRHKIKTVKLTNEDVQLFAIETDGEMEYIEFSHGIGLKLYRIRMASADAIERGGYGWTARKRARVANKWCLAYRVARAESYERIAHYDDTLYKKYARHADRGDDRLYIVEGSLSNVLGSVKINTGAYSTAIQYVRAGVTEDDWAHPTKIVAVDICDAAPGQNCRRAYKWRADADHNSVVIKFCGECGWDCSAVSACPQRKSIQHGETSGVQCASCAHIMTRDELRRARAGGWGNICPTCQARRVHYRYSYHNWRYPARFTAPDKRGKQLHMGFEWELHASDGASPSELAKRISLKINTDIYKPIMHFEADGSLNNYGCECISEPMTLAAHVRATDKYKAIEDEIAATDADCYVNTSSGLHVHIDRDYFEGKDKYGSLKIAYLVERFSDVLGRVSERHGRTSWCASAGLKRDGVTEADAIDEYAKLREHQGHQTAVNIANGSTIEVRIYAAPKTVEGLMLRLDLTQAIARMAKKMNYERLATVDAAALGKYITRRETLDEMARVGVARATMDKIRAEFNRVHHIKEA